jgi:signal peptidase complex subunit 1
MDYEGQRLSELLFQWIICGFGAVGWVIGYIHQDFHLTFYVWLVGVTISVIVRFVFMFVCFVFPH